MRGRKPKPFYLKDLDGNTGHRAKRPAPKPCIELSSAPSYLNDAARREFERLSGTCPWITASDAGAVELAAVNYSFYRQAIEALASGGVTYKANGLEKVSAWYRVAETSMTMYLRACSELGATPVSRTRVDAGEAAVVDELEDWQKGN